MFKLVINHLDKIFVTSDTATIVKEMEVVHPAAKLVVEAARKQEQEVLKFYICNYKFRLATEQTLWLHLLENYWPKLKNYCFLYDRDGVIDRIGCSCE